MQIDAQGIENMLITSISIIYDYGEGKRNFENKYIYIHKTYLALSYTMQLELNSNSCKRYLSKGFVTMVLKKRDL